MRLANLLRDGYHNPLVAYRRADSQRQGNADDYPKWDIFNGMFERISRGGNGF